MKRPLPRARAVFIEGLCSGAARKKIAPLTNELDLRGYRCPVPVIRLEAALRALPDDARIVAVADDPIAAIDIPHFCREAGHLVERLPDRAGACVFMVTRKVNPA